jgi:hypothetical protein
MCGRQTVREDLSLSRVLRFVSTRHFDPPSVLGLSAQDELPTDRPIFTVRGEAS